MMASGTHSRTALTAKSAVFALWLLSLLPGWSTPAVGAGPALHTQSLRVDDSDWQITLPAGIRLDILTTGLDGPRLMTFLPNGDLLIGSKSGRVYRMAPPYTNPGVLLRLDDYPHSVAWHDGELLIARTGGLYRVTYTPGQPAIDPADVELVAELPAGGGHSSRSVGVGPDTARYVFETATGELIRNLLSLLESRHHFTVDLVNRTSADRVVRMVLHKKLPGRLQEAVRVVSAKHPSHCASALGVFLKRGLNLLVGLFDVDSRGKCPSQNR